MILASGKQNLNVPIVTGIVAARIRGDGPPRERISFRAGRGGIKKSNLTGPVAHRPFSFSARGIRVLRANVCVPGRFGAIFAGPAKDPAFGRIVSIRCGHWVCWRDDFPRCAIAGCSRRSAVGVPGRGFRGGLWPIGLATAAGRGVCLPRVHPPPE
jgi:hypothetical protein